MQNHIHIWTQRRSSPLPDDAVRVFGHVVVADDVVHAGQGFVHVLLQPLQVLRLFVDRDDGVLQLHQTALKRRQDGNLWTGRQARRSKSPSHEIPERPAVYYKKHQKSKSLNIK